LARPERAKALDEIGAAGQQLLDDIQVLSLPGLA
jgi:hypothetical protein